MTAFFKWKVRESRIKISPGFCPCVCGLDEGGKETHTHVTGENQPENKQRQHEEQAVRRECRWLAFCTCLGGAAAKPGPRAQLAGARSPAPSDGVRSRTGHHSGCGVNLRVGCMREATDRCISLTSISLPLPPSSSSSL